MPCPVKEVAKKSQSQVKFFLEIIGQEVLLPLCPNHWPSERVVHFHPGTLLPVVEDSQKTLVVKWSGRVLNASDGKAAFETSILSLEVPQNFDRGQLRLVPRSEIADSCNHNVAVLCGRRYPDDL